MLADGYPLEYEGRRAVQMSSFHWQISSTPPLTFAALYTSSRSPKHAFLHRQPNGRRRARSNPQAPPSQLQKWQARETLEEVSQHCRDQCWESQDLRVVSGVTRKARQGRQDSCADASEKGD